MSYTNGIDNPELYFQTKLYTGTGSAQSISSVGFQPDWVWCKDRTNTYDHVLFDAVRGATKRIISNSNGAETTASTDLTSFDSDGFTVGSGSNINNSGNNFVSWNWKANGQGSSNTDGSINTTYTSANTTSGFSISTYSGTGSAATIGHGIGQIPALILVKRLNSTEHWVMYHHKSHSTPEDNYIRLNDSGAVADFPMWNDTAPTSSVFSVGTNNAVNASGSTYVAYCFSESQSFSKFGKFTGNGDASNSTYIHLGFRPSFFMCKKISASGEDWRICDNKRDLANVVDRTLKPNLTAAEADADVMDFLSTGVKLRTSDGGVNGSGSTYIFLSFAESPLVNSNGVPNNAR